MEYSLLLTAYMAVATFVTVWTFYWGILRRPPYRLFSMTAYALITLTCVAVGLAWPLFIPGLAILTSRQIATRIEEWRREALLTRAARAKI